MKTYVVHIYKYLINIYDSKLIVRSSNPRPSAKSVRHALINELNWNGTGSMGEVLEFKLLKIFFSSSRIPKSRF